MNLTDTATALAAIARARADEFHEKLTTLSPDAKNERKALIIGERMASHAGDFAKMPTTNSPMAKTEMIERRIFREFRYFAACEEAYNALTDDDAKGAFRAYAFAVGMVRSGLYDRRWNEFESGQGSAAERFECGVICGVLGDILEAWQEWWEKNGSMACEVPE